MEAIDILRRVINEKTARNLGKDARLPRQFTGQISASDFAEIVAALPVDIDSYQDIQDPTTGELYFVLDASIVGGSDPVQ